MKRRLWPVLVTALLAGCMGGDPPGPEWRIRAAEASESYYTAVLTGRAARAEASLRRAMEAASRSDNLTSLARVHLGRAAIQVALRREPDLERPKKLIALAGEDPELAAYRRFLAGRPEAGDGSHLPKALAAPARHLRADEPGALAESITGIDSPRRRVVAAAVAHRRYPHRKIFVDAAVDAASDEGWRAVLLTWLPAQAEAAERMGSSEEAAAIRQRLRWLQDPLAGRPESEK